MIIIPAIDLIDGKCVRLTKGNYDTKKVYNDSPLEMAKIFEDAGFKRLHLVDLDGAKAGKVINIKVLEQIAANTKLIIDFGGGIKTDGDLSKVFEAGAQMANFGSIAVKNKEQVIKWKAQYGAERMIICADTFNRKVSIAGWQNNTDLDIFDFIADYVNSGFDHFLCTDISKDGMLQGSSVELYKEIMDKFPTLRLIASGGVSSIEEIALLKANNVYSAVVGKAIYEEKITLEQLINIC